MLPAALHDEVELIHAEPCFPSVSIIMPFEPKMCGKQELELKLEGVIDSVQQKLEALYSPDQAKSVVRKLEELFNELNYSTYKQSIAIFVSPSVEKVYYLDIPVHEKIEIDEMFEIRDLVKSKKDVHKYLILVLSADRSRIFLGNTSEFIRIASNMPAHAAAFDIDDSRSISHFSDPSAHKEIMLEKFLRNVDRGLDIIIKAYELPLFVIATERTLGHFKKITRHFEHVVAFINGNFEDSTEKEICAAIAPHVADWKKVKQEDLLHRLDLARGSKKLSSGIRNVSDSASHKMGRLLVVENNFMHVDEDLSGSKLISMSNPGLNYPCLSKDLVDDVIEKVLENGGDVEFVDEGVLQAYDHIAMTLYYSDPFMTS